MRRSSLLPLCVALPLACCAPVPAHPSLPPRPTPQHESVGVQVWNGLTTELTCRVFAEAADGRVVELAEALRVPVGKRRIDPSLGDDPNRAREVQGWLPPGAWRLVVAVGAQRASSAVQWPADRWGIAYVGADGIRMLARPDPVRLE